VDGDRTADLFVADIHREGSVVVYSQKRLALGDGVEQRMDGADLAYKYRYTGLWLMTHMKGRFYLVGDDWQPGNGTVIILSDSDTTIRFEFGTGRTSQPPPG
jgi:hypothetical protein